MPGWETVAHILSAIAVSIALCGFLWQVASNVRQRRYDKSAFRLTSALEAFEEARKLLDDGNNDRVTWIAAARALERGNRMAEGISEQVHCDVFSVQRDRYRRIFGDFVGYDNPAISGAFFYGAPVEIQNIDEAAKNTASRNDRPQIRSIPERTLRVIWDFAQFPTDYEDPISGIQGFSENELQLHVNHILWPGLFEYLQHQKTHTSIGGQLRQKQRKNNDS